jgi:hypothetical protein
LAAVDPLARPNLRRRQHLIRSTLLSQQQIEMKLRVVGRLWTADVDLVIAGGGGSV